MGTIAIAAIAFISQVFAFNPGYHSCTKKNVRVDQQKAYAVTETILRRWSREGKKNGIFQ
jgi:hypothetical protein